LHAIVKGVVCYEISRNSDLTYRLYDYNRLDPKTHLPRELHLSKAFDNVMIPCRETGLIKPEENYENGVGIIEYRNVPGEFILRRIRCQKQGTYNQDEFGVYTVGRGAGTLNGIPVKLGDTYLVSRKAGDLDISGDLDLLVASYRDVD